MYTELFGYPAAGKTTIVQHLHKNNPSIIIDRTIETDKVSALFSVSPGFLFKSAAFCLRYYPSFRFFKILLAKYALYAKHHKEKYLSDHGFLQSLLSEQALLKKIHNKKSTLKAFFALLPKGNYLLLDTSKEMSMSREEQRKKLNTNLIEQYTLIEQTLQLLQKYPITIVSQEKEVEQFLSPNITVLFTGKNLRQRRKETILHPPEGITFLTTQSLKSMPADYEKVNMRKGLNKGLLGRLVKYLRIPNIRYVRKAHYRQADILYTPGQLLLNRKPFVVEIDNVACLGFYNYNILHSFLGKQLINYFLRSRYCKGIVCISEAAKESIVHTFSDKKIQEKCVVIYPYVKLNDVQRKAKDKVTFLCCNRKFYMKGVLTVLEAFKKLNEQYHDEIALTIVSNTPEDIKKTYQESMGNITFYEPQYSKEELYEQFYSKADVFVQPTLQDSFGLVYLEVMANSMAVISTDIFAIPEFVQQGKNGYLIKAPFYMFDKQHKPKKAYFPRVGSDLYPPTNEDPAFIQEVYEAMETIIKGKKDLPNMQKASLQILQQPPFSEETRLARLKKVFKEALH